MNRKIFSTTPSSSANASPLNSSRPLFLRRLTNAASVRARYPVGRLVDPYLLDRLQVPLTRYRD